MSNEPFKYKQAIERLEEIVRQIEEDQEDIDTLLDKLKESKALIKQCKDKLYQLDQGIKEVMEEQD